MQADIVIVGAGLVGASLAVALRDHGLRVIVMEKNMAPPSGDRPISLNYRSQQILERYGVWSSLAPHACAINRVHVSEAGRLGRVLWTADEMELPALGYVVPYALLHQALLSAIEAPMADAVKTIETHDACIEALCESGASVQAKLLVAADGAQSHCRQLMNLPVTQSHQKDQAMIAYCEMAEAHQQVAYERFTELGIIALLPMYVEKQLRLVWTVNEKQQQTIDAWTDQDFVDYLNAQFQTRIGPIKQFRRSAQFPLQTIIAKQQTAERFVLLGNAAHAIYPVAAQGFNLGLRDVDCLANLLINQSSDDADVLARYVEQREADQRRTYRLTRFTHSLSNWYFPLLDHARGVGLLSLDALPWLKRRLGDQAAGLLG